MCSLGFTKYAGAKSMNAEQIIYAKNHTIISAYFCYNSISLKVTGYAALKIRGLSGV
jgi:hypothetical protein